MKRGKIKISRSNYDIIGDIHGNADKLKRLLHLLEYNIQKGVYQHPTREAIYLGDFIDRGPRNREVIEIVRPMIESEHAYAVMGNHEFNAICFHSNDSETKKPLREHSIKNQDQHKSFLSEYPLGQSDTEEVIEWFKTLPIFLELNDFRVIHACWDQKIINQITSKLNAKNQLDESFYVSASKRSSQEELMIETLIKGREISLPDGITFPDEDGNPRPEIRVKWWENGLSTYRDAAMVPNDSLSSIPDVALKEILPAYPGDSSPVFFGHYWFTGTPRLQTHNAVCLDYSAGKGGPLVAYQWAGDSLNGELNIKNIVMVD